MNVVHRLSEEQVAIRCPGCKDIHVLNVAPGRGWGWNGSLTAPTFTPSLLSRCGHYAPHYREGESCWCTYNREHANDPAPFECGICHSFVNDGQIQFLTDSTHALAGQTVPLPPYGDVT